MKINLKRLQNPPSMNTLAEARVFNKERKAHAEFERVRDTTKALGRAATRADQSARDLSHDVGKVVFADELVTSGYINYSRGDERLENTTHFRVDAELDYTPAPLEESFRYRYEPRTEDKPYTRLPDGELDRAILHLEDPKAKSELGTYEYEKKKTVETWTHTPLGGEPTTYELSRGTLTVIQGS